MILAKPGWRAADGARLALVWALTMAVASTLYWPQAMLVPMRSDLGEPAIIALIPSAILLGYAAGVTALAVASRNLADRSGLAVHALILVTGLASLAAAPNAIFAVAACLLVGIGCAMTQRLLIVATNTYAPERRGEIIGLVIASGLSGIVVARAWVGELANDIGWRPTLVLDGAFVLIIVLPLCISSWPKSMEPVTRPISAPRLWRHYPVLRQAAFHQAIIFAAFNAGWAILPTLTKTSPATRAAVAGVGALTAIVVGRGARKLRPACLAAIAPIFIIIAVAIATLIATRLALIGAMVFVEIGTQLALVANQTRAQAVAPDVGSRGRIASLVTAVGFAGGALGAAIANIFAR